MALTTENSGNLNFQNSAFKLFTGSKSIIGKTAAEIANLNELPVEENQVFTFTLTARTNGSDDIVTPHGTVSRRKAIGKVVGFRVENNLLVEETDETKATHAFWIATAKNRIVTVEGKSYITAPAVV